MHVGRFNPYNGVTDELCEVWLARGLEPDPHAKPDETEELEQVPLTVAELEARIASGEIWDGMTLAAWGLAKGRVG